MNFKLKILGAIIYSMGFWGLVFIITKLADKGAAAGWACCDVAFGYIIDATKNYQFIYKS